MSYVESIPVKIHSNSWNLWVCRLHGKCRASFIGRFSSWAPCWPRLLYSSSSGGPKDHLQVQHFDKRFIELGKLLCSWLWFIIIKGYRLKSAKEWDLFQAGKADSTLKSDVIHHVRRSECGSKRETWWILVVIRTILHTFAYKRYIDQYTFIIM